MISKLKLLTIILSLSFMSCDRIKNKGQEVVKKAELKVKRKSKDLVDKVIPHFDPHTPDTKYNKKRFKEFLQVELTADIKNIYCFDDAIGIDADYQFSFNCDTLTVSRIIEKHTLSRDTTNEDFGFGLQHDFDWWDKRNIEKLKLYSWEGERESYKYFWYDSTAQKAYFFVFTL